MRSTSHPKEFVIDFAVADWDRDGKPDLLVRQVFLDQGKQGIYWYKSLGGTGLPRPLTQNESVLPVEARRAASRSKP